MPAFFRVVAFNVIGRPTEDACPDMLAETELCRL